MIDAKEIRKALHKGRSRANSRANQQQRQRRITHEVKKEHRIILLGCPGAGKSTLALQMLMNHDAWGNREERLSKLPSIGCNVMSALISLIYAMPITYKNELELDQELVDAKTRLKSMSKDTYMKFSEIEKGSTDIETLWKSDPVQETYKSGQMTPFHSSGIDSYFLKRIDEIFKPEFIPSDLDVLHTIKPTTMTNEHSIEMRCSDDCEKCTNRVPIFQLVRIFTY